jgi:hypothetical protein
MPDSDVHYEPIRHRLDEFLEARRAAPSRRGGEPIVSGWHSEQAAAELLGEHIQTRRRNRSRGIGPKWVRHGRDILYPDGAEEEYLAELLAKAEAEREPRRRGRPRGQR